MTTRTGPGAAPADKLEQLHRQLTQAVADLASSHAWRQMLTVAARFHDYSPSNVLLICAQRPDATRVAGIRTRNSLGRRVRKGEHGIAVLAPCIYRPAPGHTTTEHGGAAPASTGLGPDAGPRADSSAGADDAQTRHLRGFKVVHIFDVTQTDGDPLPDVAPEHLTGPEFEGLWANLAGLADTSGYRLERGPTGAANGYTDFTARTVCVSDALGPAQAVKTLAHELGHIRADHEHRFTGYATSRECRGQAEVEAESIAYLVTAQYGLDSTAYSVPYLAGWSSGDTNRLQQSMTTVITCARAIAATPTPLVTASPTTATLQWHPTAPDRGPTRSPGGPTTAM